MPVQETIVENSLANRPKLVSYSHLLERQHVGVHDRLSKEDVLALIPQIADWDEPERIKGVSREAVRVKTLHYRHRAWFNGTNKILAWLKLFPGDGWQQRWVNAGASKSLGWIDTMDPYDTRSARVQRLDYTGALSALFLQRVILPSYDNLYELKSGQLLTRARAILRPDLFARLQQAGESRSICKLHIDQALAATSKVVVHTGRDVDALTADDLLELFAWSLSTLGRGVTGLHLAWDLLTTLGVTPAGTTMRSQLLHGQRPTEDLVDDYQIHSAAVRQVLIKYLDQRRTTIDYATLASQVGILAGRFWADIERHHPGIDSLHLPDEVAAAWKERIRTRSSQDGEVKHRQDLLHLLTQVRAFYLDIQEWAREDPSWVAWAVPSPVSRREVQGHFKVAKKREAAMHQRIRERLPHLPLLADTAFRCRDETAGLLAAAEKHPLGEIFGYEGKRYQRVTADNNVTRKDPAAAQWINVRDTESGVLINVSHRENEMFWAWAVIEALRHTGCFSRV